LIEENQYIFRLIERYLLSQKIIFRFTDRRFAFDRCEFILIVTWLSKTLGEFIK